MSNSIAGNQYFVGTRDVRVNPSNVTNALNDSDVLSNGVRRVLASFSPRALDDYALVDTNGNRVRASPSQALVGVTLLASSDLACAGLMTVQVGGAPADVLGAPQPIATAQIAATLLDNATAAKSIAAPAVVASRTAATDYVVNATTGVAVATAGSVNVILDFVDTA